MMPRRAIIPLLALALLTGAGPGRTTAGEEVAVGSADRVIRATVSKVEEKDGVLAVTIPAGKADGVREGFEFISQWRGWTGKVIAVTEGSSVLEVKAELKPRVSVGDLAETRLTTVLAEARPGEKPPEPAPVRAEAVEGLQLVLIKRETVTKFAAYVDKDGNPVRPAWGQQKPPEGAVEKVTETKSYELCARLRNVGDKPVALGCNRGQWGLAWSAPSIKLSARDAEGKEVPRADMGMPTGERTGPSAVVVLKPGQFLEQQFQWLPFRFPAEGKYVIWATLEDQPRPEALPGVTPWSGKLKSNDVDWEYKGRMAVPGGGPWGGPGGGQGGGPGGQPAPAPVPLPGKEVF
ncbi:MAG TPA: hypothetical protein PK280_00575 [Planctomycetota bacterium]|nr:hypothetical protein [Planctomycetota bacterium]